MEECRKIWGELSPDSAIKEDEKDTDEVKELKQKASFYTHPSKVMEGNGFET